MTPCTNTHSEIPPTATTKLTEDKILDKCHKLYPNIARITDVLIPWVHKGRESEIDMPLVNALLFLDRDLAISILRQLCQPHAQLENCRPHKIGKINGNSVIIPLLLTANDKINVDATPYTVDALLDCGASGLGYLNKNWVAKNGIPTKTLPYPIPVYNADGTRNKNGSITHTAELTMAINDHTETLNFCITDIGSSDVILGFSWLHWHNPLVDWRMGNLCFNSCPPTCHIPHIRPASIGAAASPTHISSLDDGPDDIHIRGIEESTTSYEDPYDPSVIERDWCDILANELSPDDDSLLCVDLNNLNGDHVELDPCLTQHL